MLKIIKYSTCFFFRFIGITNFCLLTFNTPALNNPLLKLIWDSQNCPLGTYHPNSLSPQVGKVEDNFRMLMCTFEEAKDEYKTL